MKVFKALLQLIVPFLIKLFPVLIFLALSLVNEGLSLPAILKVIISIVVISAMIFASIVATVHRINQGKIRKLNEILSPHIYRGLLLHL